MSLSLRPITVARALPIVRAWHRRLPRVQGAMWAVSVVDASSGEVVGVALVGHPSRTQTTPTNEHLRVLRVAVCEGASNACSMLLAACWRAARAMGCQRMDTHTHLDEPGTSLRAAGWTIDPCIVVGGEWSRPSRPRQAAVDAAPKRRWWAPGSNLEVAS